MVQKGSVSGYVDARAVKQKEEADNAGEEDTVYLVPRGTFCCNSAFSLLSLALNAATLRRAAGGELKWLLEHETWWPGVAFGNASCAALMRDLPPVECPRATAAPTACRARALRWVPGTVGCCMFSSLFARVTYTLARTENERKRDEPRRGRGFTVAPKGRQGGRSCGGLEHMNFTSHQRSAKKENSGPR